jgi:arylsulfatase A-like enzyme
MLAAILPGCTPPVEDWNVVIVLVDTLRADHLSLYGHERATSPVLQDLDAVVFSNASAQAGCTFPSVNSLLTSRYPVHFLGQPRRGMSMIEGIPTLGEMLQARGYATAAISASPVVRDTPSETNWHGGFGRGFETFHEDCLNREAACVNQAAFDALDRLAQPFFLYLHYMEPHNPYQPPPEHPRRFARFESEKWFVENGQLAPISRMLYGDGREVPVDERDKELLRLLYDEEIRYFDGQLELLLERLRRDELLDRTLLVVLSDHGEELFDHGHISHCRDLAYQTVLSTPLLIRIPGVEPAVRSSRVQNLDVVPTILDYLEEDAEQRPLEEISFDGKSLRPVLEADRPIHRTLFAMQGRSRAVLRGRFKLLHDLETRSSRLFDLESDPGETSDVGAEHPEVKLSLEKALAGWLEQVEGGEAGRSESVRRANEIREQLEAVGYL